MTAHCDDRAPVDEEAVNERLREFTMRHLELLIAGDLRAVRAFYAGPARIYLEQNDEVIVATPEEILSLAQSLADAHGPDKDPAVSIHHIHHDKGFAVVDVGFTRADGVRVRGMDLGWISEDGPRLATELIRHIESGDG